MLYYGESVHCERNTTAGTYVQHASLHQGVSKNVAAQVLHEWRRNAGPEERTRQICRKG